MRRGYTPAATGGGAQMYTNRQTAPPGYGIYDGGRTAPAFTGGMMNTPPQPPLMGVQTPGGSNIGLNGAGSGGSMLGMMRHASHGVHSAPMHGHSGSMHGMQGMHGGEYGMQSTGRGSDNLSSGGLARERLNNGRSSSFSNSGQSMGMHNRRQENAGTYRKNSLSVKQSPYRGGNVADIAASPMATPTAGAAPLTVSLFNRLCFILLTAALFVTRMLINPLLADPSPSETLDWLDPLHFLSHTFFPSALLSQSTVTSLPRATSLLTWHSAGYQRTFLLPWLGVVWMARFIAKHVTAAPRVMVALMHLLNMTPADASTLKSNEFEFFFVRFTASGLLFFGEILLARSIRKSMGTTTGSVFLLLSLASGISFQNAGRLTPESMLAVAVCLIFASFIIGRSRWSVVYAVLASLFVSPLIALIAIPVILISFLSVEMIATIVTLLLSTIIAGAALLAGEYLIYGRLVYAPLQALRDVPTTVFPSFFTHENMLGNGIIYLCAFAGALIGILVVTFLLRPKTSPRTRYAPSGRVILLTVLSAYAAHSVTLYLFRADSRLITRPLAPLTNLLAAYGLTYILVGEPGTAANTKKKFDDFESCLSPAGPQVRTPNERAAPRKSKTLLRKAALSLLLPLLAGAQLTLVSLMAKADFSDAWQPVFKTWHTVAAQDRGVYCSGNSWRQFPSAFFLPSGSEFHVLEDAFDASQTFFPLLMNTKSTPPQGTTKRTYRMPDCNYIVDFAGRTPGNPLPKLELLAASGAAPGTVPPEQVPSGRAISFRGMNGVMRHYALIPLLCQETQTTGGGVVAAGLESLNKNRKLADGIMRLFTKNTPNAEAGNYCVWKLQPLDLRSTIIAAHNTPNNAVPTRRMSAAAPAPSAAQPTYYAPTGAYYGGSGYVPAESARGRY